MHHTRPKVDYTHMPCKQTHSLTHRRKHMLVHVLCVCVCVCLVRFKLATATVFDCAACLPPGNKLNDLLNDVHFMQLDRARVISSERKGGKRGQEQALCADCILLQG